MAEYTAQTDAVKTVTLHSEIQRARWLQASGAGGEEAELEVLTHFVGDDSEVEVEVRTTAGARVEKAKGNIWSNRFRHSFVIPDGTTDDLSFTAKLPAHGLEESSPELKVFPRRAITNARWDRKEARRGDVVKLQADTEGIPDGTEVKISIQEWDRDEAHDPIGALTSLVENSKIEVEWEYQYQADTEDIPSEEELEPAERHYEHPEYIFTVSLAKCRAESGRLLFKDWIDLALVGPDGEPFSELEYELVLPDGTTRSGQLDQNGEAKERDLPPGVVKVEWKFSEETSS